MKISGYILLLFIVVAGCKPKNEKMDAIKAEAAAFEKDWAATGDMLKNWGLELEKMLESRKTQDSLKVSGTAENPKCDELKPAYDKNLNDWEVTGKSFTEWKAMLDKDQIKPQDATKTLKNYKASLDKFNKDLEDWKKQKEDCEVKHVAPQG